MVEVDWELSNLRELINAQEEDRGLRLTLLLGGLAMLPGNAEDLYDLCRRLRTLLELIEYRAANLRQAAKPTPPPAPRKRRGRPAGKPGNGATPDAAPTMFTPPEDRAPPKGQHDT